MPHAPALRKSGSRTRRAWWLLPLLVLGLFVAMGWGMWRFYQERELRFAHQIEGGLGAINQLQAEGLADWRQRRLGEAMALMDDAPYARAVARWRAAGSGAAAPLDETVHERLRSLVEHMQYSSAQLVDPGGRLLMSAAGPAYGALPVAEQAALASALDNAQPAVVGLRRDPAFSFVFYSVLAPLYDGSTPVGAIWLVVDARTSLYPLLQTWPNNSATAESLLVQREGGGALYLSPLRHRGDEPLTLRVPAGQQEHSPALQAIAGVRGAVYGTDYLGHPVLATVSAVPDSDWLLVSKIDRAEVFSDAQRREWLSLGLLVSLGLMAAGCMVVLWQWRAWRRERTLKETLQRNMRWLDAAQKAAAVGYFAYDGERRKFTMSRMANVIFGRPDAGSLALPAWIAMLHEDEREHVLAVHGKAMDERRALRLQYRIRRASDQQVRWIEVWGEYDTAYGAQPARMTGTVQDITERKQVEEQLESYRAALEARVRIDPLTQVANRLALDEVVAQEWARAERSGDALALLMVDVDHFKAFNDHYGHMAGDICLQAVARALVGQTGRAGDMLARYGGEEFAMLLPGADLDQARAAAERLCQAVRELGIEHEHGCACGVVSISVGVASLHPARQGPITGQPRSGVDVAQKLFQQADTALYCAKHRGRDQVADFCADCDQVLHDPPDSLFAPGP